MRRALLLAAAVLALTPAAAPAATTVGQNFTPTVQVGTSATVLAVGVASGTSYTVPADGVLTSWSFRAADTTEPMKFKVARPQGGSQYLVVAESETVTPQAGILNTYPIRVSVKAGDVIGFYVATGNMAAGTQTESDADQVAYGFGTDSPPGTGASYFVLSKLKMNVSAQLEADADGDGFGDETQDLCPSDPSSQDKCTADLVVTAVADRTSVFAFEEVAIGLAVANNGRNTAPGTVLTYDLPPELEFESMSASARGCSGRTTIKCSFGSLATGDSQWVVIKARARRAGRPSAAATVTSGVVDPDAGNNSAALPLTIEVREGACANTWVGDGDNNSMLGSPGGDSLFGQGGHDLLAGLAGDDCLDGGDGSDRLIGGTGRDTLEGGPGRDSLSGQEGNDRLYGDDGDDVLSGGPGHDRLHGGAGNDRLMGGAGDDRLIGGPGRDRFSGGSGDDVIDAADGVAESVDCGPGRDRARVDVTDRVKRCERVVRVRVEAKAKAKRRR